MEHNLTKRDGLPMLFIDNPRDKQVNFATFDIVMVGDVVQSVCMKGTIKEILEERPSRGKWDDIGDGEIPTTYKVQLH